MVVASNPDDLEILATCLPTGRGGPLLRKTVATKLFAPPPKETAATAP